MIARSASSLSAADNASGAPVFPLRRSTGQCNSRCDALGLQQTDSTRRRELQDSPSPAEALLGCVSRESSSLASGDYLLVRGDSRRLTMHSKVPSAPKPDSFMSVLQVRSGAGSKDFAAGRTTDKGETRHARVGGASSVEPNPNSFCTAVVAR